MRYVNSIKQLSHQHRFPINSLTYYMLSPLVEHALQSRDMLTSATNAILPCIGACMLLDLTKRLLLALGSRHQRLARILLVIDSLSSLNSHLFGPLHATSPASLDNLACERVIGAQHRPARAIGLFQRKLKLGAHDLVAAFLRVNGRVELHLVLVALLVLGAEVEGDGRGRAEFNGRGILVNLLEEEGRNDLGGGLVEVGPTRVAVVSHWAQHWLLGTTCVLPDVVHNVFLLVVLLLAHEQVLVLGLAALNLHELIEFQHSSLATGPTLATLVEESCPRVVDALLSFPALAWVILCVAAPPLALLARLYRQLRVIVLVFLWLGRRSWRGRLGLSGRETDRFGGRCGCWSWSWLGRRFVDFVWLRSWRVVHVGMLPGRARWDTEELVEVEDAGLAALPA